jgi:hypothetical protein
MRLCSLLLVLGAGCGESAAPSTDMPVEAPVSQAAPVLEEPAADEELISFRIAGFVKAMGIT